MASVRIQMHLRGTPTLGRSKIGREGPTLPGRKEISIWAFAL